MHRKLTALSISIIVLMLVSSLSVISIYSTVPVSALPVKPNVVTPTLTLSATEGDAYDSGGSVATDFINVTGTGFNPGADVALYWVATYPSAGGIGAIYPAGDYWAVDHGSFAIPGTNEPNGCFHPSLTAETIHGDVSADASGWWTCQVIVPSLPAGTYHLDVMQGPSMGVAPPAPPSTWAGTAGVAFTINPSVEETGSGGSVVPGAEGYVGDAVEYWFGGFGTYTLNTGVAGEFVDVAFAAADIAPNTFCLAGTPNAFTTCITPHIATGAGAPPATTGLDHLGSLYGDTYTVTATGETSGTKATTAPSGVGGPGTATTFKIDPHVYFWDGTTASLKGLAVLSYDFTLAATPFYVSGEGFPKGAMLTGATLDGVAVSGPFPQTVSAAPGGPGPTFGDQGTLGGGYHFLSTALTMGTTSSNAVEGVKDFALTLSTGTVHFTNPDPCFDSVVYAGTCKVSPPDDFNNQLQGGILNSNPSTAPTYVGLLQVATTYPGFTSLTTPTQALPNVDVGDKGFIFMAEGLVGSETGVEPDWYVPSVPSTTALGATRPADGNGAILMITTIGLPKSAHGGTYYFKIDSTAGTGRPVTAAPSGVPATIQPTVIGVTSASNYVVGSPVGPITGEGFAAGDTVSLTFGGVAFTCTAGTNPVAADGEFVCTAFTIPDMAGGLNALVVSTPTITVTIDPQIIPEETILLPSSGPVGSSVIVRGHGFDAGTDKVYFGTSTDGVLVATVTVTSNGLLQATFSVPPAFSCGGDGYCWIIDFSGVGFSTLYNLDFKGAYVPYGGVGDAFPTFDVFGVFLGAQSVVHIGDVVPISVTGLVPNTHYQLDWGYAATPGFFTGIDFVSTATGTTPAGFTFTIPNTLGPYGWPLGPLPFFNRRWLTIEPYGMPAAPPLAIQSFVVVPSYTLSASTGPAGTSVTVTGVAFCSSAPPDPCPHDLQVVFGGDPTQITGLAFLKPGTPVAFIGLVTISFLGDWTATFVVPNVPNGVYDVWIWEDVLGTGIQTVGEVATLLADIKTFTVGTAVPGIPLGPAVQSIYGSATGLGFEETGNTFDNSGAGFAIAHRSTAKVVFTFSDSTRVNPTTHELNFAPDYGNAVVFAGPAANPTTAFYETNGNAPVTASVSGGTLNFMVGATVLYSVTLSSLSTTNDYFLMEAFTDGSHTVVVLYGVGAPGTLASGVYFDANFANFNAANYPASAYIVHWQGTTPNVPLPTDTYTIVAHT